MITLSMKGKDGQTAAAAKKPAARSAGAKKKDKSSDGLKTTLGDLLKAQMDGQDSDDKK